jgi:hypothetical protein
VSFFCCAWKAANKKKEIERERKRKNTGEETRIRTIRPRENFRKQKP